MARVLDEERSLPSYQDLFGLKQVALATAVAWLVACHSAAPPPVLDARSAGGLAYDLVGEGPLVVLVHGTNLDRRMWDAEVAWLEKKAKVLRYDLRGQGGSDDPASSYSNHGDLVALLDELGEPEATLIGLSAGAQVVLDVAVQSPDRVRRMVLVSPSLAGHAPETLPPFFADLSAALRARDFDRANEVLLESPIMAVPPALRSRVRTMVAENSRLWTIPYTLVEQVSPPAIQRLDTVKTPTLVLVGENDLDAVHDQAELLEREMPEARRLVVAGGGHLLNLTSPDGFRDAVREFLGEP